MLAACGNRSATDTDSTTTSSTTIPVKVTAPVEVTAPPVTEPAKGSSSNPLPMGSASESVIQYVNPYSGSTWKVELLGIISIPELLDDGEPTQCVAVVGALKAISANGSVASAFDAPRVSFVNNGRVVDSGFNCDAKALETEGFGWLINTDVMVGSTILFYDFAVLASSDISGVTLVAVGTKGGDDTVFFAPNILLETPSNPDISI